MFGARGVHIQTIEVETPREVGLALHVAGPGSHPFSPQSNITLAERVDLGLCSLWSRKDALLVFLV